MNNPKLTIIFAFIKKLKTLQTGQRKIISFFCDSTQNTCINVWVSHTWISPSLCQWRCVSLPDLYTFEWEGLKPYSHMRVNVTAIIIVVFCWLLESFAVRLSRERSYKPLPTGIRLWQTGLCLRYVMGNGKGDIKLGLSKVSIYVYACISGGEDAHMHTSARGGCPPDILDLQKPSPLPS